MAKAKKKSYRQTGLSNKKVDKRRKAKAPGKRTSATGKTYTERRKNRSDVPHTLTGIISQGKQMIIEKIGTLEARKFKAKSKRDKKRIAKEISALKIQYRKLN